MVQHYNYKLSPKLTSAVYDTSDYCTDTGEYSYKGVWRPGPGASELVLGGHAPRRLKADYRLLV